MVPADPSHPEPHRDPTEWSRIVESLDIASLFVVLGTWIGPKLAAQVTADDIWQETLWLSWRDREQHEWGGLSKFRAWLLAIARNRVRDASRNLGRQKRGGEQTTAPFSALAGPDSISVMLPHGSTTPSRTMGHRERALAMERALGTLEPQLRTVVQLRLFEELPIRAVAEQLGLPLSTAKEQLRRGVISYRRELQRILGPDSIARPAEQQEDRQDEP